MSGSKKNPAPLATLPGILGPYESDRSLENRKVKVEGLGIRAWLKP